VPDAINRVSTDGQINGGCMFKNIFLVMLLVVTAAGCGGMKAQSYIMTTNRVDIESTEGGNAGYISGKAEYQEPARKTRKVYVLEVTKAIPEGEITKVEEEIKSAPQAEVAQAPREVSRMEPEPEEPRRIVIPRIDDVVVPSAASTQETGPTEDQTYKVLKDDTLQKIAKKFYGSYGKWIKIYEANKDNLKNPNFVRPGIELVIPAVEKK